MFNNDFHSEFSIAKKPSFLLFLLLSYFPVPMAECLTKITMKKEVSICTHSLKNSPSA